MTEAPSETEQHIHDAFVAGRLEDVASATLDAYGSEILSFLTSRLRDRGDAQEAFSMFAEDLWSGLPKFSWRCSMRTWSYTLARNASIRFATSPQRRAQRNIALCTDALAHLIERARSATHIYQKTEVKDRFKALREQLDSDDQMLLVLRVDRGMAWRDLAITMSGDENLGEDEIDRESVRLRKAFERVKSELKRLAKREGLLKARE